MSRASLGGIEGSIDDLVEVTRGGGVAIQPSYIGKSIWSGVAGAPEQNLGLGEDRQVTASLRRWIQDKQSTMFEEGLDLPDGFRDETSRDPRFAAYHTPLAQSLDPLSGSGFGYAGDALPSVSTISRSTPERTQSSRSGPSDSRGSGRSGPGAKTSSRSGPGAKTSGVKTSSRSKSRSVPEVGETDLSESATETETQEDTSSDSSSSSEDSSDSEYTSGSRKARSSRSSHSKHREKRRSSRSSRSSRSRASQDSKVSRSARSLASGVRQVDRRPSSQAWHNQQQMSDARSQYPYAEGDRFAMATELPEEFQAYPNAGIQGVLESDQTYATKLSIRNPYTTGAYQSVKEAQRLGPNDLHVHGRGTGSARTWLDQTLVAARGRGYLADDMAERALVPPNANLGGPFDSLSSYQDEYAEMFEPGGGARMAQLESGGRGVQAEYRDAAANSPGFLGAALATTQGQIPVGVHFNPATNEYEQIMMKAPPPPDANHAEQYSNTEGMQLRYEAAAGLRSRKATRGPRVERINHTPPAPDMVDKSVERTRIAMANRARMEQMVADKNAFHADGEFGVDPMARMWQRIEDMKPDPNKFGNQGHRIIRPTQYAVQRHSDGKKSGLGVAIDPETVQGATNHFRAQRRWERPELDRTLTQTRSQSLDVEPAFSTREFQIQREREEFQKDRTHQQDTMYFGPERGVTKFREGEERRVSGQADHSLAGAMPHHGVQAKAQTSRRQTDPMFADLHVETQGLAQGVQYRAQREREETRLAQRAQVDTQQLQQQGYTPKQIGSRREETSLDRRTQVEAPQQQGYTPQTIQSRRQELQKNHAYLSKIHVPDWLLAPRMQVTTVTRREEPSQQERQVRATPEVSVSDRQTKVLREPRRSEDLRPAYLQRLEAQGKIQQTGVDQGLMARESRRKEVASRRQAQVETPQVDGRPGFQATTRREETHLEQRGQVQGGLEHGGFQTRAQSSRREEIRLEQRGQVQGGLEHGGVQATTQSSRRAEKITGHVHLDASSLVGSRPEVRTQGRREEVSLDRRPGWEAFETTDRVIHNRESRRAEAVQRQARGAEVEVTGVQARVQESRRQSQVERERGPSYEVSVHTGVNPTNVESRRQEHIHGEARDHHLRMYGQEEVHWGDRAPLRRDRGMKRDEMINVDRRMSMQGPGDLIQEMAPNAAREEVQGMRFPLEARKHHTDVSQDPHLAGDGLFERLREAQAVVTEVDGQQVMGRQHELMKPIARGRASTLAMEEERTRMEASVMGCGEGDIQCALDNLPMRIAI